MRLVPEAECDFQHSLPQTSFVWNGLASEACSLREPRLCIFGWKAGARAAGRRRRVGMGREAFGGVVGAEAPAKAARSTTGEPSDDSHG